MQFFFTKQQLSNGVSFQIVDFLQLSISQTIDLWVFAFSIVVSRKVDVSGLGTPFSGFSSLLLLPLQDQNTDEEEEKRPSLLVLSKLRESECGLRKPLNDLAGASAARRSTRAKPDVRRRTKKLVTSLNMKGEICFDGQIRALSPPPIPS